MEKQLTAHLLRTLLDDHFDNKSDMARKLGVEQRAMQNVLQRLDYAKGGTIVLDKALLYCAQNHISLDRIVDSFSQPLFEGGEGNMPQQAHKQEAYNQLHVTKPDGLTPEGVEMYESMLDFVRRSSALVCPTCKTWCNPWSGEAHVEQSDCYIGHIIKVMIAEICDLYTAGDESDDT